MAAHYHYICSTIISGLFAVIVVTVFALSIRKLDRDGEKEHFYLDLTSRAGFACPEVTNFVSEFDPLYKWALGSSLPTILSEKAGVEVELATSAYQQASVWRVISNWTSKNGASNLYASAEPHIAGVHMKQYRQNWLWRMDVDLGISARMCLFGGTGQSNRSCLWTTPVLATKKDADLGLLFAAIPYRAASDGEPRLSNMQLSKTGSYLSNYASNARTDFTKSQTLDGGYYITNGSSLPSCGFSPSYYSPDAMTYLAFSSLQCGCSNSSSINKVCVVATKNIAIGDWGSLVPGFGCDSLKSYWAWNAGGSYWLILNVYKPSAAKGVPFIAEFKSNNTFFSSSFSSIGEDDLRVMGNVTACVEASVEQSDEQIVSKCGTKELQLSTNDAAFYFGKMQNYIWVADPPKENASSSCLHDLPLGQLQFSSKLCVRKLDKPMSDELKLKIQTLLEARDVKYKMKKLWKAGSDARHTVYTLILAGFVSVITAIATVESTEDGIVRILNWFKCGPPYVPGILEKILFRGTAISATAGFVLLYPTYSAVKGIQRDRDFLQAQTVPQVLSDSSVMLLTVTATYVVEPIWNAFCLICAVSWIIVTGTVFWIGHKLAKQAPKLKCKVNDMVTAQTEYFRV